MKFEITHPKIWKAVNEKKLPMKHKIQIYEKLGGAYRLGEDGGEQVYNKMTELLKSRINEGPETQDHEVSMAGGQLDDIIRNATELKGKVGQEEIEKLKNAANGRFCMMEKEDRLDFELLYKLVTDIYNRDLEIDLEKALSIVKIELQNSWLMEILLDPS